MELQFTGDFRSLDEFTARVKRAPTVLRTVNDQLAGEALALVAEGFDNHTDPYGEKWDEPMLRGGKPLEDVGNLKTGWFKRWANRDGFAIGNATKQARFAQEGTGLFGPKKRRIVPRKAKALRIPVRGSTGGITSVKGYMYVKSVAGMKPRKMVPDAGLPARWRARFVETAQEVLTELFR